MKTDNELIAEFMNYYDKDVEGWWESSTKKPIIGSMLCFNIRSAQFNSSWDWLMPVVEKIGYMKENYSVEIGVFYNPVSIRFQECAITGKDGSIIVKYSGLPLIECTYKAVVDFIKWYNSQTQ